MKDLIIKFRMYLLKHFKSKYMQTLIYGLISYEMLSYMFFGLGTSVVDYIVFSTFTAMGINSLISNIISTICAIIFAYITNRLWVFRSKTTGFVAIMQEFIKFAYARTATLIMTEVILLISEMIDGNAYIAKLIAMLLTIVLNYIFSKLFIFNDRKGNNNETSDNK